MAATDLAQTFLQALEMRCREAEGNADAPPLSFDEVYALVGLAKRRVPDDGFLDPDEACELLRIKKSRLYYLTHTNQIPHRKIGRSLRFLKPELVAFMDRDKRRTGDERAAS